MLFYQQRNKVVQNPTLVVYRLCYTSDMKIFYTWIKYFFKIFTYLLQGKKVNDQTVKF